MVINDLKSAFLFTSLVVAMVVPSFIDQLAAMPKAGISFNEPDYQVFLADNTSALINEQQTFMLYRVKLQHIKLIARQGYEILVLPVGLHINFVQYHNVAELLETLSIPSGVYERVILSLDYSQAQAEVKGPHGYPQAVMLMDDNHKKLKTLEVSISLLEEHEFDVLWGNALIL